MAFTDLEIAAHLNAIENAFWARCRPPLHLRDQMREGQRIKDQAIELFFVRPAFRRPGAFTEESIAKLRYVRRQDVWRIFWKRADGRWHGYEPFPEAVSLPAALQVVREDVYGCFFG